MKGYKRRTKDGLGWHIEIFLGENDDGKQNKINKTLRLPSGEKMSANQADEEMNKIMLSLVQNTYIDPGKLTLGQFMDRWLKDYAETNTDKGTYTWYKGLVKNHVKPLIGNVPLVKLSAPILNEFYADRLKRGKTIMKNKKKIGEGPLKPNTVNGIYRMLHAALECAVKWDIIYKDIAEFSDPPKIEETEMHTLSSTNDSVDRFLEASRKKGSNLYLFYLLAIDTGARRSEIIGLRWSDVDLRNRKISIRQSIKRINGKMVAVPGRTKGKNAKGQIDISSLTADELKAHRKQQLKQIEAAGPLWEDNGLVITRADGTPIRPEYVSKWQFKDILKQAEIPEMRLHDLRHSCATILLEHGAHPKTVQERLRHAKMSTTMDTYSHVMPTLQQQAAKELDEVLRRGTAHK